MVLMGFEPTTNSPSFKLSGVFGIKAFNFLKSQLLLAVLIYHAEIRALNLINSSNLYYFKFRKDKNEVVKSQCYCLGINLESR